VYASILIRWSGLAAVVAGVLFLIVELLAIDLENLGAQATMGIFFCGPGYSCSPRCCYCWDWLGSTPTSRRLRASWGWQASSRHSWVRRWPSLRLESSQRPSVRSVSP
jgi:hypothetical protein